MKFPKVIRHRKAEVTIYGRKPNYPFCRIAYRVAGKRLLRNYSKYGEALKEAEKKVRELGAGSRAAALTANQSRDALNAFERLDGYFKSKGHRISLNSAVEGCLNAVGKLNIPLSDALEGYLKDISVAFVICMVCGCSPEIRQSSLVDQSPPLSVWRSTSDDAQEHFIAGREAWSNGSWGEAITEFTKAIDMNPQYADAYLWRGIAKSANRGLDNALADINKAIEIKPDLAEAYSSRGKVKQAKGDLDGALADFNKAIELKPDLAEAYTSRGKVKQAKGDLDGALADFSKAIELKPDLAEAYGSRGNLKQAKGDLDGALADFRKVIELRPDLAEAYNNSGRVKQLKLDSSLDAMKTSYGDYDREFIDAVFTRWYVLLENRSPGTGKVVVKFRLYPEGQVADLNIVHNEMAALFGLICVQAIREPAPYRPWPEEMRRDIPKEYRDVIITFYYSTDLPDQHGADANSKRGLAKAAKGDLDGASADYNTALQLDGDFARAYNNRGLTKAAKGDLDGAIADYNTALQLNKSYVLDYCNRAIAKRNQNNWEGALADYNTAIELNPKYTNAYRSRGHLRYDLRDFTNALIDFRKAIELDGSKRYDFFAVWLIRSRLGETRAADAELQTHLAATLSGKADDWDSKVGHFLIGELAEKEFLAATRNSDPKTEAGQLCEAYFFAASKHLLTGDKTVAMDYFQKSLATGKKRYWEYNSATAELKFLKAEKN